MPLQKFSLVVAVRSFQSLHLLRVDVSFRRRESMRCMQQQVLAGPMRVPQLQRRRSNLASLETTLELVARVQQSQAAIEVCRSSRFCPSLTVQSSFLLVSAMASI